MALNRVFSLGVEILHMCLNYHHELLQLQYLSHVTSVEVSMLLSAKIKYLPYSYLNYFRLLISSS